MNRGMLRHRITIYNRTVAEAEGGSDEVWVSEGSVSARIRHLSAREIDVMAHTEAMATCELTVAVTPVTDTITHGSRIDRAGRTFKVVSVRNKDELGRYYTLLCAEEGKP